MKLVFFGAPGAGKGTIAKKLYDIYKIPQVSTGDLFREAIKNKTELGDAIAKTIAEGKLVSDDIAIQVIKERIAKQDCSNGYILDGFPRTLIQAEKLENLAPINIAVFFDIKDEEVKTRLCGRRICPKCGRIYHIDAAKPKIEGVCDDHEEKLIIRPDDREEAIVERLKIYHRQTEPLLSYYKKINKLEIIDASKDPDVVTSQIIKKIKIKD